MYQYDTHNESNLTISSKSIPRYLFIILVYYNLMFTYIHVFSKLKVI